MKPHVNSRRQRYLNHLSFQAILHPLENPGALPKPEKNWLATSLNVSCSFLRIQISFCNLIDVWFPFWKIYIKQTWQTKKSELQEWQTQGGFSLVHTMIYQVLGRLKEEGVLRGHLCRDFWHGLPFHGYWKNNFKLLLFLGSHPTHKKQIYVYIIYQSVWY